jgi:UDP-glucose 4-epimerase
MPSSGDGKHAALLGHQNVKVLDLVHIIARELDLKGVGYDTTGGERGWLGDTPFVDLDTTKLKRSAGSRGLY